MRHVKPLFGREMAEISQKTWKLKEKWGQRVPCSIVRYGFCGGLQYIIMWRRSVKLCRFSDGMAKNC